MAGRLITSSVFFSTGILVVVLISVGFGGEGWFVLKLGTNSVFKDSFYSIDVGLWAMTICTKSECTRISLGGLEAAALETPNKGDGYLIFQVPMVFAELLTVTGLILTGIDMLISIRNPTSPGLNLVYTAALFFTVGAGSAILAVIRGGVENTSMLSLSAGLKICAPWALIAAGFGGALALVLGISMLLFGYIRRRAYLSSGDRVILTPRVV